MIREDCADMVYKTQKAKFDAVIEDIVEHHQKAVSYTHLDVYKRQELQSGPHH